MPQLQREGSCVMQDQQKRGCNREYVSRFGFRSGALAREFIQVHTFGGRGSPSL
jgi:hypothetical protein